MHTGNSTHALNRRKLLRDPLDYNVAEELVNYKQKIICEDIFHRLKAIVGSDMYDLISAAFVKKINIVLCCLIPVKKHVKKFVYIALNLFYRK